MADHQERSKSQEKPAKGGDPARPGYSFRKTDPRGYESGVPGQPRSGITPGAGYGDPEDEFNKTDRDRAGSETSDLRAGMGAGDGTSGDDSPGAPDNIGGMTPTTGPQIASPAHPPVAKGNSALAHDEGAASGPPGGSPEGHDAMDTDDAGPRNDRNRPRQSLSGGNASNSGLS